MPQHNVSDLDHLSKGYDNYNPFEAYTTSKLLNLVHVKEFVRRFPDDPEAVAYTPGVTPDNDLARANPKIVTAIVVSILRIFYWFRGLRSSMSAYSGGYMAGIAAADSLETNGWHNGDYISIDRVVAAPKQACDPALGKAVWDKSEEWVRSFAN